jgi:hypothetical protein
MIRKPFKLLFLLWGLSLVANPAYSEETCTVNSFSNGTLSVATQSELLSNETVGQPGKINLTCSAGTTFTITAITNNGTLPVIHDLVDGVFAAIRNGSNTIIRAEISPSGKVPLNNPLNIVSSIQTGPVTNQDYFIDLSIFKNPPQWLPAGTYSYRVNILLTPQ